MRRIMVTSAVVLALVGIGPLTASAQDAAMYQVKITNLTPGQSFTPFLLATHSMDVNMFLPGTMASDNLRMIAEMGKTEPMMMMLEGMKGMGVMDVVAQGHMLNTPGVTTEFMISGMYGYRLSLVSMLIPTNDTFVGTNMMLPMEGGMMGYAYAYDAGTEMNDELCSSIPNPAGYMECDAMGAGAAVGMGEGAIVISNGINGHGDFMPMYRDWKNPVARITITKM